ncbi:hypothetical protein R5R35_008674 [Gryllus longicercus]|uniref:Saccharopine dehydrogenase NADP binding domain-containing protein n=1 Tax=Gryllus longicercus TaxID=2509291 RepID=A0AAN9VCV9_9ORTH
MSIPRLDIVVFGATGFTGKYAVHEVLKLSKDKGGLSWGVSGRNEKKLRDVLKEVSEKSGEDLSNIEIIVADVSKEETLLKMAARAKVVVNCAGPYRFYGEPVVKACIASGTHHVDVSGEPQYMERMQLEYHEAAEKKGVYIVSACGFDSIPADIGTVFLQDKFEGTINSVETYLEAWSKGHHKGSAIHYGTWESAVYGLAHANELRPLRTKLFPNRLPQLKPKLKPRSAIHRSDVVQGWCVPFPGSDRSVILRSQRHFFDKNNQRPAQVQSYVAFRSLFAVAVVALVGAVFAVLARFRCGRSLLLKYPSLFSFGMISHEGPSEEAAENTFFALTVRGEGWKEKLAEPTDHFTEPPNKTMSVKVTGRNPGYGATTTMLVMTAFMCLTESDKMPSRGGVYPPGAAFAKTSLIQQLIERGVKFEVLSSL